MPIQLPFPIRNLSPGELDKVDAVVMPCAYAAQNLLGRLYDERIYENRLLKLLWDRGLEAHSQQPIVVTHHEFSKTYFLDLIVNHAIYELKTVQAFVPEHDAQVFHYAMLANVNHIKLLNFRQPKVQGLLRFNAVLSFDRHQPQWQTADWKPITPQCDELRQRFQDLIADWGTHLDFRLFDEALVEFCGGEALCKRRVPVTVDGRRLGTESVRFHAEGVSFLLTGFDDPASQIKHVHRLCHFTQLRAIQWFNLNNRNIQLATVTP